MINAETIDYAARAAFRMTPLYLESYREDLKQEILLRISKLPEQYHNTKQSVWYSARSARRDMWGIASDNTPTSRFAKMFKLTSTMSSYERDGCDNPENELGAFIDKASLQSYQDGDVQGSGERIELCRNLLAMLQESDASMLMDWANGTTYADIGRSLGISGQAVKMRFIKLLSSLRKAGTVDNDTTEFRLTQSGHRRRARASGAGNVDANRYPDAGEGEAGISDGHQCSAGDRGMEQIPGYAHCRTAKKTGAKHNPDRPRRWMGCKVRSDDLRNLGIGTAA